jgi:hypothetical protein
MTQYARHATEVDVLLSKSIVGHTRYHDRAARMLPYAAQCSCHRRQIRLRFLINLCARRQPDLAPLVNHASFIPHMCGSRRACLHCSTSYKRSTTVRTSFGSCWRCTQDTVRGAVELSKAPLLLRRSDIIDSLD